MRLDSRLPDQLRKVSVVKDYIIYPEGSVLFSQGGTRVLCNVTIEDGVPRWMQAQNVPGGWITAEYSLLPRSTHTRTQRETNGLSGRTQEIRRLIGRSLRSALDMRKLGARTVTLDCDVLQADGGTRTASITGSYIALSIALQRLVQQGKIPADTLQTQVAAVSVGVIGGTAMLDLCYEEDFKAEVDFNVVMNSNHEFVEIQGTAEHKPFNHARLAELLSLAQQGIDGLFEIQKESLK